ncbi:protein ACCELERATED CELL DEATH 6-like [Neltuma alba]|uniref:protein ACCELERATED CELL DEATH 6-like n=1 Tax=Neltuma alba TaxID=207710 RepID=UPI0010A2D57A|nr:protein ACCELERATED CELL DEATH 6-like [Prosopis alba]
MAGIRPPTPELRCRRPDSGEAVVVNVQFYSINTREPRCQVEEEWLLQRLKKSRSVIICGAKAMDQRLGKAAIDGDVHTLHDLLEEDPQILEKACSVHFADSPLHVAARSGKADFVNHIVTRMPSLATETNQQGMIPLHVASLQGHVETVRELLKANLDEDDGVNQCLVMDREGWTPLHCASQKGKIMVMEELISKCPQCLEQVTAKGETVLHLAVNANQFGAVNVLVERIKRLPNFQTLLKAQDQKGQSAYQLAAAKRQYQVLEVLKEDEEEGGEISEERQINVEGEGSDNEASEKEKSNKEGQSQEDAIRVAAALFITLTYQALANLPSLFVTDGRVTAAGYRFLFVNTVTFLLSIRVLVPTLMLGPRMAPLTVIAWWLCGCYATLLIALDHGLPIITFFAAVLIVEVFHSWPQIKERSSHLAYMLARKMASK